MVVLTFTVHFFSPATVPPPTHVTAPADSQAVSAVAANPDTALPAPTKKPSTKQPKVPDIRSKQVTQPPSDTPLLAQGMLKPLFIRTAKIGSAAHLFP